LGKYIFQELNDTLIWGKFSQTSKEYSLFNDSIYLNSFGGKYKLYLVKKGDYIKAGLVVILKDEKNLKVDDLVIYSGILFEDGSAQKSSKVTLERFEISNFIIEELDKLYEHIEFVLSPYVDDIRAFLWHNYHSSKDSDKYSVSIRYTSYLDISSLSNFINEEDSEIFKNLETLRKRNIREARKKEAYTIVTNEVELFILYYKKLMLKQDQIVSMEKLSNIKNLITTLVNKKKAKIYVSKNSQNEIQYITIFAWDKFRAYYLFGAPNPDASERYRGTISFWDAFIDLAHNGVITVDMEGVNSPQRGWFKLSFGGNLKTYYHIKKAYCEE